MATTLVHSTTTTSLSPMPPATTTTTTTTVSLMRLQDLASATASNCKRLSPPCSLALLLHENLVHCNKKKRRKTTTTTRKRVSFSSSTNPTMQHTIPRHEETWYTLQEYSAFEESVRATIRIMRSFNNQDSSPHHNNNNNNNNEEDEYCQGGLEKYCTLKSHQEKKMREGRHLLAILTQQELQKLDGQHNPDALRKISQKHSKCSIEIALQQAAINAKQVGMYVHESMDNVDNDCKSLNDSSVSTIHHDCSISDDESLSQ